VTLRFLSHRNYKRSRKKTFCFHSQSSCYSRVVAFSFFLMYSDLLIDVFQYLERNEIEKGRYVSRYWNFTVRNSYLNNAFVIYRLSFKYEPVSPNLQIKNLFVVFIYIRYSWSQWSALEQTIGQCVFVAPAFTKLCGFRDRISHDCHLRSSHVVRLGIQQFSAVFADDFVRKKDKVYVFRVSH